MKNLTLPYILLEGIFIYFFVSEFGVLNFILEVILSAVLGLFLVFKFGFMNLTNKIRVLNLGDIFGSFGTTFGAFLIFLPGILSDIAGVFIIAVSFLINKKFKDSQNMYNNTQNFENNNTYNNTKYSDSNIIDVEIIEEDKDR